MKRYFYGTNLSGIDWYSKFGGQPQVIKGWKEIAGGRVLRTIFSCKRIVETTKKLSIRTIKKYEFIILTKQQRDFLRIFSPSLCKVKMFGNLRYYPGYTIDEIFYYVLQQNDDIHTAWNFPDDVEKLLNFFNIRRWKRFRKSFLDQPFIPKEREEIHFDFKCFENKQ